MIDRSNLVAPPAIQMYSDQQITVILKNPNSFERYFLDYQAGQATVLPDVASSIVQAFEPSLPSAAEWRALVAPGPEVPKKACAMPKTPGNTVPKPRHVEDVLPAFGSYIQQLAGEAAKLYGDLEPYVAPDSTPKKATRPNRDEITSCIADFLDSEYAASANISNIANDEKLKKSAPDAHAILELSAFQKFADGMASDLAGYKQRLMDLQNYNNGAVSCSSVLHSEPEDAKCVVLVSATDDDTIYQAMVTRTVTYSLNVLNLVSNSQEAVLDQSKKKSLVSLNLTFADMPMALSTKSLSSGLRWETSAGVFFSTLAIRSFSPAPVFTNTVVTDNLVSTNVLHPTVVPFAAANYRITNDLGWSRWKSAVYLTGVIGVNPNTVSADFGAGPSISWRALMFSFLWHYGHEVKLTQGLQVGQSLGPNFNGSLSTQSSWKSSFALGISVRVPALSGR